MNPIPEHYKLDMEVVRLSARGNDTLVGKVTKITKTRLTATFTVPGREDLTTTWFNRGWSMDPLALTEHGNSSYAWSTPATLVPADDPRVATAKRKQAEDKLKADIRAAVAGFVGGTITPERARALRGALNNYITKAEELANAQS
jgi:hypothetical protein